jgi:hydroxymethylpyrimidine/phosphomethylpyrimidine kinase
MTSGHVHALSIAGSDPSGGAGIQADLKTFAAVGAYGMCAITALTVQNTQGVRDVHSVPAAFVEDQIDAIFDDIRVDAVKIGMLGEAGTIRAVADRLAYWRPAHIVVDPVMVAKSGHRLLATDAVEALRERLLPQASVITPNLPEAGDLLGDPSAPADVESMHNTAERLAALGPRGVLVKGGHLSGDQATDVLYEAGRYHLLHAPRVATENTHGTGCTLSSAIAALRPRADSLAGAVQGAKRYLSAALQAADGLAIGHGRGPVNHAEGARGPDPAGALLSPSKSS